MALQFTPNRQVSGNLNFSANLVGRLSVFQTVDWSGIQNIPTAISSLGSITGTGVVAYDSGTYYTRTITGTANEITATNGTGAAGNPTLSLPSALTFTGKTITGGTFSSPTLTDPTINDTILWTSGGDDRMTQGVGVSQNVISFTGVGNSKTASIHLNPGAGTLATDTVAEFVLQRTADQAFGSNYGRWSFTALGADLSNITALHGEYGGTVTPGHFTISLGIENPVSTFTDYEFLRCYTQASGGSIPIGAVGIGGAGTTQKNILVLEQGALGAPGTLDSNTIMVGGKSNDGSDHAVRWRQWVDVTSNAGASTYVWQNQIDGAGWTTRLSITDAGALTAASLVLSTTPLIATSGGTGFASYAVGDLLYASTTTALSKLADVATGSVLASGGVNTAPAWSASPTLTTSLTVPIVYGGSAAGSQLDLISTSNGAPSADFVRILTGGAETVRFPNGGGWIAGTTAAVATGGFTPKFMIYAQSNAAGLSLIRHTTPGGGGGLMAMGSSRGTIGSYSAIQSGDGLGSFTFFGDDGADYANSGASFGANAAGNWSTTSFPTRLNFNTCASGTTSQAECFRLDQDGRPYFPLANTTASAANAYIDNATSPVNELKRSTSSEVYKRDIEALDMTRAVAMLDVQPIWYRSKIETDNQKWSWYGFRAEDVAKVDPRLVHYGYQDDAFDVVDVEEKSDDGASTWRRERRLKPDAKLVPDGVMYDRIGVMHHALLRVLWADYQKRQS